MKDLTCKEAGLLAVLSACGELDERQGELLGVHARKCRECGDELKSFTELRGCINAISKEDVPEELIRKIKADSREILSAGRKRAVFGRLILKPGLALLAALIIIFSFMRMRPSGHTVEIVMPDYNEYLLMDARLVAAENSLQAINLELSSGLNDF